METLVRFLILPSEISDFERTYLRRVNRVALLFLVLHVPVFVAIAAFNGTRPLTALGLTLAVLVGPISAHLALPNPRSQSIVHGIAAMLMGAILVHLGQGPAQIEMHFYFFALIAMCAVFGNPMVIVWAALTVVVQHLVVWIFLPRSVFNYDAAYWVVGIHAIFVLLDSVAASFIARGFFDNVIGLERIVTARTRALDLANQRMRTLLDNVHQGFLVMYPNGELGPECSQAVVRWFGAPVEGQSWLDYLRPISPRFELNTRVAWAQVVAGLLPLELTLAQMPRHFIVAGANYEVAYQPIGTGETPDRFLIIISDITDSVQRESAELELREAMAIFERVVSDRSALEEFADETSKGVCFLLSGSTNGQEVRRVLHTLKGNSGLYGLRSLMQLCEEAEERLAEGGSLGPRQFEALSLRWRHLLRDIDRLLGGHTARLELEEQQYDLLEQAVLAGAPRDALLLRVHALKLEPTSRRLRLFAEQAHRIAQRLGKEVTVHIEDHGLRLEREHWAPFWSHFVHCIRNAMDHGLESPRQRITAGKSGTGNLTLRTQIEDDRLVVEVEDDGRGVDWARVRAQALKAGMPADSPEHLEAALFVDGMSTASEVSDLSGRGVGLGAVLQSAHQLGGSVRVRSQPGSGTVVRVVFPLPVEQLASVA